MHKVYQLLITSSAQNEIRKLQSTEVHKIIPAIQALSEDPQPSGCKKLTSVQNTYRIRIGDYPVLYSINDAIRIVEIARVKHRREAYE